MKLLIDIPDKLKTEVYDHGLFLCPNDKISLVNAINHGIPQETVTEFADRCSECGAKYGKLLKQKPSGDLISREAVEEIINDIRSCISVEGYWAILERMKKLPPVKPQERTGHWITLKDEYGDVHEAICSNCDSNGNYKWVYCPNCGADMRGEQHG